VTAKTKVPAVEGWFTLDAERPALLGSKCRECGIVCFPRETSYCRNPACTSREFDEVELSRTGRLWSFTDNRYQPPPPYVSPEPFESYAIAAVELEAEQMVVLGQLVAGVDVADLHAGDPVELVLDTLYSDDEHDYLVWKWQPA
jgi:uncharacterized OB-fold protein